MDQRAIERLGVGGTVIVRIGDEEMQDELRDLSVRGCRIAAEHRRFRKGADIDLTLLEGLTVGGTVRWSAAGSIGVEFGEAVSEAAVRYFLLDRLDGRFVDDVPFDVFGRRLPSMSQLPGCGLHERRIGSRAN